MKPIREEFRIIFTNEVSIEVRYEVGEILVWDRGTGYGQSSMFDALEKVREIVGNTKVREISTIRKTIHKSELLK